MVPCQKGIPPNVVVDSLARNGLYLTRTRNWVAPEDLMAQIRRDWIAEKTYALLNSDYPHFPQHSENDAFR